MKQLQRPRARYLFVSICVFVLLFGAIVVVKAQRLGYNAIDFGIFQQIFFETSHGMPFGFSIHPHSYLGDHIDLAIALVSLLYRLAGSLPETLLVFQVIAVALGAWPLYHLASRRLGGTIALFLCIGYLLHPIVANILLFEFHMLPFAIPILLWACYWYDLRRLAPFIACLLAALLIREDVALIVVGFALLALVEQRRVRWWLPTAFIGAGWFAGALVLAERFNPDDTYKFLTFYGHLGETPMAVLLSPLTKPLAFFGSFFSFGNVVFVVLLLLLFGLLPLFGLKKLLPTVFVAAQLLIPRFSPEVTLLTHYTALLIPFLLWASVSGLERLQQGGAQHLFTRIPYLQRFAEERLLGIVLLVAVWLYGSVTLGPLVSGVGSLFRPAESDRALARTALELPGPTDGVVASYELLAPLASRQQVASLHYAFIGHRQYSDVPYTVPQATRYLMLDSNDFLFFQLQYEDQEPEAYHTGDDRLRELISDGNYGTVALLDRYLVLAKDATDPIDPYVTVAPGASIAWGALEKREVGVAPTISVVGSLTEAPLTVNDRTLIPVTIGWLGTGETKETYQLLVTFRDGSGNDLSQRLYAFGHGLYPTDEIEKGQFLFTHHTFLAPSDGDAASLHIELVRLEGSLGLDALRSVTILDEQTTPVGEPVDISL